MTKIFAILSMVSAPLLGHYLYEQYKVSECLGNLEKFTTTFEQRSPSGKTEQFRRGMSTAKQHCEDGDFGQARQVVQAWSLKCRVGPNC